ncbi:MAG: galactokinase [Gemmatimonadota bacterium]|nr:MAG: galactokinase [Gemmatimonadota bacterium]
MEASPHLEILRPAFRENYGDIEPTHLVQAPGRVNLMGDHIDYNGLSVLPVALRRHVAIILRPRADATVRIASTDPRYSPRSFDLASAIEPYPDGDWGNYVKAAGQALARLHGDLKGFDAVVHSDIPVAAGLSSSSALVVASDLAVLHTNDVWFGKMELAELLAEAEHYVGTRGGGMDQAICLAARRHSASRIYFGPLRLTAHPIPPEWHFIVAFSLVPAEKSGSLREIYNARTRECRDAFRAVVQALDAADHIDSYSALLSDYATGQLLDVAGGALQGDPLKRFRHVLTEAERVAQAEKTLVAYDSREFGRLMTESHTSLRDDFEVSIPELDELVDLSIKAGALGARLTGAGLGGCVVVLSTDRRSDRVMRSLAKNYYAKREFDGSLEDCLFVVEASAGASVVGV